MAPTRENERTARGHTGRRPLTRCLKTPAAGGGAGPTRPHRHRPYLPLGAAAPPPCVGTHLQIGLHAAALLRRCCGTGARRGGPDGIPLPSACASSLRRSCFWGKDDAVDGSSVVVSQSSGSWCGSGCVPPRPRVRLLAERRDRVAEWILCARTRPHFLGAIFLPKLSLDLLLGCRTG